MSGDRIVVVGSLNFDLVVEVERLPSPGETVLGHRHFGNPGGKGANQAVAAARLGGDVAMVGCVGTDESGEQLLAALRADGVATDHVRRRADVATGLAVISVDAAGENAIVVSSGANGTVSPADVARAAGVVDDAAVCLLQLEIPDAPVVAAARRCGGLVVLDPAPARTLPAGLLADVDVLIPNEHELAELAGGKPSREVDTVAAQARQLGFGGTTIVTLGAAGAVVLRDGASTHVGAPKVDVVDTTAAGDAFRGAFADAMTRGADIVEAVRRACAAGAFAATRSGAQAALPTPADISNVLGPGEGRGGGLDC